MKKYYSLFVSIGVLLALAIYLIRSGRNTNTQTINLTPSTRQTSGNESEPTESHYDAVSYLVQQIQSDGDTSIKVKLSNDLLDESTGADQLRVIKNLLDRELDAPAHLFCTSKIALIDKNWDQLDELLDSAIHSIDQEFIVHAYEPILEKASEQNPNPRYLNMLSDIYLHNQNDMGRFMTGVRTLKKVLELDSNNEAAIYKLGVFAVQSNQLEKAKQRFKKLISLQPENEGYRKMLQELCEQTNDSDCLEELVQ